MQGKDLGVLAKHHNQSVPTYISNVQSDFLDPWSLTYVTPCAKYLLINRHIKNKEQGLFLFPLRAWGFLSCVRFGTQVNRRWVSGGLVRSRTVTLEVPELHFLFYYFKAYLAVTLFSAFSYHIIKLRQTLPPLLPPSPLRPPRSWHLLLLNLLFKNTWTRLLRCEPK